MINLRPVGLTLAAAGVVLLAVTGTRLHWAEHQLAAEASTALAQHQRIEREPIPVMGPPALTQSAPDPQIASPVPADGVWGTVTIGDLEVVLTEGTDDPQLDIGAGHYVGTAAPGDIGNAALAIHRGLVLDLDEMGAGDEIHVDLVDGTSLTYVWRETLVVDPEDVWVLDSTPDVTELTITTCHPRFSTAQRLVVRADLKEETHG